MEYTCMIQKIYQLTNHKLLFIKHKYFWFTNKRHQTLQITWVNQKKNGNFVNRRKSSFWALVWTNTKDYSENEIIWTFSYSTAIFRLSCFIFFRFISARWKIFFYAVTFQKEIFRNKQNTKISVTRFSISSILCLVLDAPYSRTR